jgi:hypothetical protein
MATATKGQFIKYTGPAHRRQITADEWKAAGFNNGETVVWDWNNGFSVPLDSLTPEQVKAVINPDNGFIVLGGEDHAPRPMSHQTGEQAMGKGQIGVNLGGVVTPDASAQ